MNTTSTPQKSLPEILDEIEQRANAATPVPWGVNTHVNNLADIQGFRGVVASISRWMDGMPGTDQENVANADFIAAARSDVPKLVKALRRALVFVERYAPGHHHGKEAQEALSAIAQLLSEPADSVPDGNVAGADQVTQDSPSPTPSALSVAQRLWTVKDCGFKQNRVDVMCGDYLISSDIRTCEAMQIVDAHNASVAQRETEEGDLERKKA